MSKTRAPATPSRRPGRLVLALVLFVFSWLLYANTLVNEFVWDDRTLIVENADIRSLDAPTVKRLFTTHYWDVLGGPGGLYRPLSALSLHLDYQLYGKSPAGFHATNATLNALVTVMVFVLVLQLFARVRLAFLTALLFAALPLHTENVAWVSGRTDVLATLFMLLSLAAYAWWRRRGVATGFVLSALAYVAAVLSKEIALVLPPLVLLVEAGPFPGLDDTGGRWRWPRGRLATTAAVFFGIAALALWVRHAVLGSALESFQPFATGISSTVALSLSILAGYAWKLVAPLSLNAEWQAAEPAGLADVHVAAGLVVAAALVWALVRWRRRGEAVFAVAVFLVGLGPVLNIFPITEVSAERFLYFPSLGFCLAVAWGLERLLQNRRSGAAALALAGLLVVAYGVRTVVRNRDWRDEATLFGKTAEGAGDVHRVHLNLGNVHYRAGRFRQALEEYQKAVDLDPKDARVWSGMAGAYKALGQLDEAFRCMQRALAIDPRNASMHNNLGMLYVQRGDLGDAVASFRRALEYQPRHEQARFNLGLALYRQRDYAGVVDALTPLEHKDADHVHAWYYLAAAEAHLGHRERAAEYATRFLAHYDRTDAFTANARAIVAGRTPKDD